MSSLLKALSARHMPIIAAIILAAVCWMTHVAISVSFHGQSVAAAFLPTGAALMSRSATTIVMSAVAALGFAIYGRALRKEEVTLRDCDLQYKTVVDSTSDSIITINGSSKIIALNSAATQTFGQPAPAFFLMDIDTIIPTVLHESKDDAENLSDLLDRKASWKCGTIQVTARGLDGREFPAELNVVPTSYGDKTNRLIFVREVTERVRAKRALEISNKKYRDLFEQMVDGVYRCHGDGSIVDANPALVRILGYSSEAELCQFENAFDMCRIPAQRADICAKLNDSGEARDMVIEITRKNGSKRSVLTNIKSIVGDTDQEFMYQGTISDLSDLQTTTAALRDSEEHFRLLAENSLDVVTVIDEAGIVHYCSPSIFEVVGLSANDVVGSDIFELVLAEDLDRVLQTVRRGFETLGTPKSLSYRYYHADGSVLHLESVSRTFRTASGELRAIINTRDISDRQKAEHQLLQAQKMQAVGQLTGGIAHDFNNLLTVIVGNLQLMEEASIGPEVSVQVDTAMSAAMRGADLTRRLLAFARQQSLEPRVISVNKLLSGMEPLLRRSLGKPLTVDIEYADDLWLSKVDPTQLESAILNLAINSRDAMQGEGRLAIKSRNSQLRSDSLPTGSVSESGEYVCISVEDDGCGMTEEVRKSAIEPFFSTKETGSGSGLGLSMVYGFVQQSGGHLLLDSEHENGTRIELYLPRTRESESRYSYANSEGDLPGGKETVLVVDDNAAVRNSAVATLMRLGYDVLSASNGPEALDVLKTSDVDMLFSDLKMPKMTGYELAANAQAAHPQLRVLLTSGFSDSSDLFSGDAEHHPEFIPKPYTKHELANKFRTILDDRNYE
ncbi:MAG: PAS domain S-box protein [Woeseiaceae bacterium]